MLGKTDSQDNFFDSYIKEYFLPQEHELLQIKEKGNFSFIETKTKDLYAKNMGRPSHPPEVMFKILFLEFYYNLSDVEVVKQLRFNVLFRYFAGLGAEGILFLMIPPWLSLEDDWEKTDLRRSLTNSSSSAKKRVCSKKG